MPPVLKPSTNNLDPIGEAEVVTLLGRETGGNDGETYKAQLLDDSGRTITGYVKLSLDPRKIIAELVTAQIGRALGLRIPSPYLVLLDTAELRPEFHSAYANQGMMICFASRQAGKRSYSLERGLNNPDETLSATIEKQFDLHGTIALDELVANDDRNLGNIMYSPGKQEFWLIDHGRALTGTYWALWGLDDPAVKVRNLLADSSVDFWDEAKRNKIINKARELVGKCSLLSLDDLDSNGLFARIDATTDRQDIINFLRERINHTVPLLCQRLHMGQLSLMPPKGS